MQQFQAERERMTPAEAEEVLRRFRDEEEREFETATNPSVADLAEGLGVPTERVQHLLAQVRAERDPETITVGEAKAEVQRQNRSAWVIAAVVLVAAFVLMAFVAMLFSTTRIEQPAPDAGTPVYDTAAPTEAPTPASDN